MFGATRHGSFLDQATGVMVFLLYSIPSFVAATVLQRILAIKLGWFPTDGFESPNAASLNAWDHMKDIAWHVARPLACYAYGIIAYISRQARSGMLQVLRADYIRTARAKGLPERTVVLKHALKKRANRRGRNKFVRSDPILTAAGRLKFTGDDIEKCLKNFAFSYHHV